jgi:hypothetical protein
MIDVGNGGRLQDEAISTHPSPSVLGGAAPLDLQG